MSKKKMYEVQTRFYPDNWENCWYDGVAKVYYDSREAAQAELDEFLADVREAVANGDMEEEYSPDDYRVVEVRR